MEGINLLVVFLLVHICFDFYFQPTEWVDQKNRQHGKSKKLVIHAFMHAAGIFIALSIFTTKSVCVNLFYSILVFISHWLIDLAKSYASKRFFAFLLDQLAHIIVLILIWGVVTENISRLMIFNSIQKIDYNYLVIILAYLIVLKPTSIIISSFLKPWTDSLKQGVSLKDEDSLQSAGKKIGYLERFLILTFILLNQFSAIGFLLAAKSVFRFGELQNDKDKKLTEYVMLGTLASLTCTIFLGLIVAFVVNKLPVGE